MTAYYVLGGLTILWAVVLTALGLTRPDFPPTGSLGRALVGLTITLVGATLVALFASTHVEHPREEAAAEAAERKAEEKPAGEKPAGEKPAGEKPAGQAPPAAKASILGVAEKEFEIDVQGGTELKPANYTFEVANQGKIEHDLAVEGNGVKENKTPLIPAGKNAKLTVDLKPAKYRLWCTVPGHAQAGMDVQVTVK
jgi:copper binding plastocyanin/azurin family protein